MDPQKLNQEDIKHLNIFITSNTIELVTKNLPTQILKNENIEIILCIFSGHNRIKLEINSRRNFRNYTNTWSMNNILLK
jgi:hypothetical protein